MEIVTADERGMMRALEVLQAGGTVVHPTETCYGIACDMTNADAVRQLFIIKKRPFEKTVSALFPSIEASGQYVEWSDKALAIAHKYLPGPLTIILPVKAGATIFASPSDMEQNTLGVRISSHPVTQKLAALCPFPISTTSANVHGMANPYSLDDLRLQYGKEPFPTLFIDNGVLPLAEPSTVIAVLNNEIALVRQGSVRIE